MSSYPPIRVIEYDGNQSDEYFVAFDGYLTLQVVEEDGPARHVSRQRRHIDDWFKENPRAFVIDAKRGPVKAARVTAASVPYLFRPPEKLGAGRFRPHGYSFSDPADANLLLKVGRAAGVGLVLIPPKRRDASGVRLPQPYRGEVEGLDAENDTPPPDAALTRALEAFEAGTAGGYGPEQREREATVTPDAFDLAVIEAFAAEKGLRFEDLAGLPPDAAFAAWKKALVLPNGNPDPGTRKRFLKLGGCAGANDLSGHEMWSAAFDQVFTEWAARRAAKGAA